MRRSNDASGGAWEEPGTLPKRISYRERGNEEDHSPRWKMGGGRASTRGKRVSARSEALGWKERWWSSEAAVKPDTGTSRGRSEKPENRFYLNSWISGGRGEDGGENASEEESKQRTSNTSYPVWLHTGTVTPISLSAHRYLVVAEAGLIEELGKSWVPPVKLPSVVASSRPQLAHYTVLVHTPS
ncbi:hypothetical protein BO78DRAFT_422880 [Aspergillus sclerotiicarbonarius CBS 121057]|uniref:Uncharacterized protein n=1 Tax=Aspergillus sclerotiicarbonarius (strain CBS 121057 / IBT 28362) TaxID=1448318 RepID=A0A319EMU3_ASPSB|nr:hypothetical protein BO78DRAFT_422880 [Aspergillus sclerotiicarbonarius CBS 121057]